MDNFSSRITTKHGFPVTVTVTKLYGHRLLVTAFSHMFSMVLNHMTCVPWCASLFQVLQVERDVSYWELLPDAYSAGEV